MTDLRLAQFSVVWLNNRKLGYNVIPLSSADETEQQFFGLIHPDKETRILNNYELVEFCKNLGWKLPDLLSQ